MTRVVLTQPSPRVEGIAATVRASGHVALACPMRRLVPQGTVPDWSALAAAGLEWVVFVSPGAIEFGLRGLQRAWPPQLGIGAIGPGSVQALANHPAIGPDCRIVSPDAAPYDAAALLRRPPFDDPRGLSVHVVRGASGREDWIAQLRARGARVEVSVLYRSEAQAPEAACLATLQSWSSAPDPVVFVFTSTDAVVDFDAMLEGIALGAWARAQTALAQHPRIAARLCDAGWANVRIIAPGARGLLDGIEFACVGPVRGEAPR